MKSGQLLRHSASPLELMASLPKSKREAILKETSDADAEELEYSWRGWMARPDQLRPGTPGAASDRSNWTYWLVQAGRGFGKTRTGAETVREWVAEGYKLIHLVGPTSADTRDVMVQGPGGLLSCYPPERRPIYEPSKRLITWPNGAQAHTFSADEPERLRGPQCQAFWADEAAAWRFGPEAWDNLLFGFRLGADPRGVITTTPKPVKLIRDIASDPATVVTRGSSYDNRSNLSRAFFRTIIRKYEGTRTGRQELMGELLEDIPGALWTRNMIEAARCQLSDVPALQRVVVAIDPAVTASETSDETGIGAIGLGQNGHLYLLEDVSTRGTPNEWARLALRLMLKWNADRIIAEVNNGGDLVEANIRAVHPGVPFRSVRASRGKLVRAEPVAALYEQRRVHHAGSDRPSMAPQARGERMFEILEDQLCTYVPGVTENSPDRMDWMVWGAYDLLIAPEEAYLVSLDPGYQISPI